MVPLYDINCTICSKRSQSGHTAGGLCVRSFVGPFGNHISVFVKRIVTEILGGKGEGQGTDRNYHFDSTDSPFHLTHP